MNCSTPRRAALYLDGKAPWSANDTTIVLEPGVEIQALRGSFAGLEDCLIQARALSNLTIIGYGATLRMWKEDYNNHSLYRDSEFRMGISVYGSRGVRIFGLTVRDTGGDGLFFGNWGDAPYGNVDCHIKDFIADNNNRQGMSISGSAIDVLFEDSTFSNTAGHCPAYGVDIEPDSSDNEMRNLTFRRCQAINNSHAGFGILLDGMNMKPHTLDIKFEDCLIDSRSQRHQAGMDDMGQLIFMVGKDALFPPPMNGTLLVDNLTVRAPPKQSRFVLFRFVSFRFVSFRFVSFVCSCPATLHSIKRLVASRCLAG
eukprot:SAG22_NODE_1122_length_5500_cov_2.968339_4_plen_313_part_00